MSVIVTSVALTSPPPAASTKGLPTASNGSCCPLRSTPLRVVFLSVSRPLPV
jgi:hypothetical protein